MSDKRDLALQGAGVVGGAIVTAVAPDLVPDVWKLPVVFFGLTLIGVSLFPRIRLFCRWVIQRKRGRMTLIFIGVLLMVTGGYVAYQGAFAGARIATIFKKHTPTAKQQIAHYGTAPSTPPSAPLKTPIVSGRAADERGKTIGPTPTAEAIDAVRTPRVLRRLIAYDPPQISVTSGSDGSSFVLPVVTLTIRNVGDDAVSVVVSNFRIYMDGQSVLNVLPTKPFIMSKTEAMTFQGRPTERPISVSPTDKMITIKLEITYDTIPETGPRISARTYQYPVNFANGTASPPLLNSPQIAEQSER